MTRAGDILFIIIVMGLFIFDFINIDQLNKKDR